MQSMDAKATAYSLAYSTAAQWSEAVQECLRQLGSAVDGATIGFIYATDFFANRMSDMVRMLQEESGVQNWVGTVGYAVWANLDVFQDAPALVLLCANWTPDRFELLPAVRVPDAEQLQRLLHADSGQSYRMALLHADPRNLFIPEMLQMLAEQRPAMEQAGGITSSRYHSVQVAGSAWNGGLSGVLLQGDGAVAVGVAQGAREFGEAHEITACEGNVILTLDGEPALDVFQREVGDLLMRDPSRIPGFIFAGLDLPNGDYLVRDILGLDMQQRLLAVGEYVEAGTRIHFCRRDGRAAWDDLEAMVRITRRSLSRPARAGIYIACVGRGEHVFGSRTAELQVLRGELGDIPIIGFAAAGEIAHGRLYGYTGVLVLFG